MRNTVYNMDCMEHCAQGSLFVFESGEVKETVAEKEMF